MLNGVLGLVMVYAIIRILIIDIRMWFDTWA